MMYGVKEQESRIAHENSIGRSTRYNSAQRDSTLAFTVAAEGLE